MPSRDDLEILNEIFRKRPNIAFRYYCISFDESVDISYLSELTNLKSHYLDIWVEIENIDAVEKLSLDYLSLSCFHLKDYSFLRKVSPSIKGLTVNFIKNMLSGLRSTSLNYGGYIMAGYIVTFIVGVICIILGVSNMRGNISSLHSYHRHRVSEEDRVPFGKQVGLGTVIIGIGIVIFSVLLAVTIYTENDIFVLIGTAGMIVGIIIGMIISFKAMIRYNKGIF